MFNQLLRYGVVTVLGYLGIIFSNVILNEVFHLNTRLSYLVVISLSYIINYFVNTKFVFRVNFVRKIAVKYIIYLVIFWLLNNFVFGCAGRFCRPALFIGDNI